VVKHATAKRRKKPQDRREFRICDPQRDAPLSAPGSGVVGANVSAAQRNAAPEIPFAPGDAVEVIQGASKGLRGRVIGPARSMYLGVADVAIRTETGREAWIRPDYLRRLT
jgi:transcription antitermination factor NusG